MVRRRLDNIQHFVFELIPLDYLPDVAMEKIKAIREIVLGREKTINKMLDFYLIFYLGLENNE